MEPVAAHPFSATAQPKRPFASKKHQFLRKILHNMAMCKIWISCRGPRNWAALLLLFVGSALAEYPVCDARNTKGETNTKQYHGNPSSTLLVKILPPDDAAKKAEDEERHRQEKSAIDERTVIATENTAIATGWLAIITAALTVFTAFLWSATGKLVKGSEKSSKEQLRAYVGVEGVFWESQLTVRIRNFGHTPANRLTIWTWSTNGNPTEHFRYVYPGGKPIITHQMLHPQQNYSAVCRQDDSLSVEQKGFVPYGRIVYSDIYGRWWVTHYCYKLVAANTLYPYGSNNREDGPFDSEQEALAVQ